MTSTQSWYLLYPSSPSSSSVRDAGTAYANCTQIIWVTVASLLGLRICTNAVRFYYFCIDWNLITQKEWADLAAMHFFKQNYVSRKVQIMDSLVTTTFLSTGNEEELWDEQEKDASLNGEQNDNTSVTTTSNNHNQSSSNDFNPREPTKHSQCEAKSCPICLTDFQEMEKICRSRDHSSCCHVFHSTCLQDWLLKHTSCPVCRYEMVPPSNLPPSFQAQRPTLSANPSTALQQ